MAYERFYEALDGYEGGEDSVDCAIELFDGLFTHSPVEVTSAQLVAKISQDEELIRRVFEQSGWIIEKGEGWWSCKSPGYRTDYIGDIEISVGSPDPLPSSDMLERLGRIILPDASYQPDGPTLSEAIDAAVNEHDDRTLHEVSEREERMAIAINIRGAILFTTWLLSGYGDDIQPNHDELESLLARYTNDGLDTLPQIRSLSARVAAELAFQRRDYATALSRIADSIDCVFDIPRNPINAPWLLAVGDHAESYFEHIEALSAIPAKGIDWLEIVKACEKLSKNFFFSDTDQEVPANQPVETISGFWIEKKGWAQAQLTPDQLRDLLRHQEDESAAQRLETYFFPDGLWMRLPERARQAPVDADMQLMASKRGRYVSIANDMRIATEEVLYNYLWLPLSETQPLPHPGLQMILDKPKQDRRSPSIDDYVQLLWHSGVKDYFQGLGMSDDDVRFLTHENRTTQHFQKLQRARNAAEHEPGDTVDPQTIRQLYAESLGIGRRGVLPELVRLLAKA